MKFVKVIIDGKEYYRMENENAGERFSADAEPEYIEVEIEDADGAESKSGDGARRFFVKVGDVMKELGGRIARESKDVYGKLSESAKDIGVKIKDGTERLFGRDKTIDPNSTEAKLLRLLPYMSKEDAHGVCEKLLESDESLKNLDISSIMPFLSSEDCDRVFEKCIALGNNKYDLAKTMPYVTSACKSRIVDGYIAEKYPSLDIDALYPFFSDADIKRLFYHIINEEKATN